METKKFPIGKLIDRMTAYEAGVPHRINHFLKVYAFAKTIGELEGLDPESRQRLEAAAVVHDIGIKPSLVKYGSSAGPYQEAEGPAVAEKLLGELGFEEELITRVCYLVSRHHTYQGIDGPDYQILVEADFLVNLYEDQSGEEEIRSVREKIFKTPSGKAILDRLFLTR